MSDHSAPPAHSACQNCGAELHGPFCHRCGQHDFEFHRSFGHVFLEALENFFHFDEKFFRNVFTLLFRPGRLSADFNAGKRAGQMPPFRLYLFISVLFFVVRLLNGSNGEIFAGDPGDSLETRAQLAESVGGLMEETKDPAVRQRLEKLKQALLDPADKPVALTDEQVRDLPAVLAKQIRRNISGQKKASAAVAPFQPGVKVSIDESKAKSEFAKAITRQTEFALRHREEIREAYYHALPKMLLVCLPLFALYTRWVFRKRGQFYLQHLIISLHYHTFVFLWWMVADGWTSLTGFISPTLAAVVGFGTGFWMFFYPFVMLRSLFGESRLKTFFKALLLSVVYGLTITAGFAITALIIVATL